MSVAALALLVLTPLSSASKGTAFTFGSEGQLGGQIDQSRGVAINETGNGGAPAGTIYVADSGTAEFPRNQRIQALDADGDFIRAWGWDVVSAGPGDTGTGFEICVAAAADTCKAGTPGGGAGQFAGPVNDVAVEQSTGNVYVTDTHNRRVQVFAADGDFIRAWGWDVVSAGPGDTGTGFEICVAAAGDTCKEGTQGGGAGQFSWSGGPPGIDLDSAGNVYVADSGNQRLQKFSAGGTFLAMAGWDVEAGGSTEFEVCTVAANCQAGLAGDASNLGEGQFTGFGPSVLAVDPTGGVFAGDQNVPAHIHRFTSALNLDPGFAPGIPQSSGLNAIEVNRVDHHIFVSQAFGSSVIYELDPTDGGVLVEHFPGSGGWDGLAINAASGRLYASKPGSEISVLEDMPTPVVVLDPVSGVTSEGANFSGSVNPNAVSTSYWFEYRPQGSPSWTKVPGVEVDIGSGTTPVAVNQTVSGLTPPNTEYRVRLAAKSSNGIVATSPERTFTTSSVPPTAIAGFAAPRSDTTARLNGYINPNNNATTYWFEYGLADCSANPCASVPAGQDASAGAGSEFVLVAEELTGLSPGTTYHFCVITENSAGATPCEDRTFATRTSAEAAPPGRGIELVNNPDKGNQNVIAPGLHGQPMSQNGEKALWLVLGGAPGGNSGSGNTFLAERTPSGWRSRALVPPASEQSESEDGGYGVFASTPDFSRFLFTPGNGAFTSGRTVLRLDADQNQDVLKTYASTPGSSFADLTDDGAHVLLVDPESRQLEDIGSGAAEPVSLMPDGTPSSCGVDSGNGFGFNGFGPGAVSPHEHSGYHWIATTDASRVYFQVKPNGECGPDNLYGLYVRNRETEETTLIDSGLGDNPEFIRATPDGRRAYFVTKSSLDSADGNTGGDVYRWDEAAGESHCLTCEAAQNADLAFSNGEFLSVMVSDDFSHVYFLSDEQLAPGAPASGIKLYVLSGGSVRFVSDAGAEEADLSSDGNVLVFGVQGPAPTADQLAASCPNPHDEGDPGPCRELYRYDSRDDSLECISCRHDGITTGSIGTPTINTNSDFAISADGSTVAFVTEEALSQLDVNNDLDVYEWRRGVRRLITDGVTSFSQSQGTAPRVSGLSADGRDVFFIVAFRGLTGFEQDGFGNLYDARIGGGFVPPSPPAHCSGESCQGPLQPPPVVSQPGSSSFSGLGNLSSPSKRCAAGKVRQGGRCSSKRAAAHRACRKRRGEARRRCVHRRLRGPDGRSRWHSPSARAHGSVRGTK